MRILATLCSFMLAATAIAQDPDPRYVIHIEVDRPVLEPGEIATVLLRAGFNSDLDYCMGLVATDLMSSMGSPGFDAASLVAPMATLCPGSPRPTGDCSAGTSAPWGVVGIVAGQLHFGGFGGGITGDDTDPISFWTAQLRAPDTVPAAAEVRLSTRTSSYVVYLASETSVSEQRIDEFIEAETTITIVPCRADFNEDGVADIFDFLAFFNAFDAGDPLADFDFDGELTVFDFLAFQDRFDTGC